MGRCACDWANPVTPTDTGTGSSYGDPGKSGLGTLGHLCAAARGSLLTSVSGSSLSPHLSAGLEGKDLGGALGGDQREVTSPCRYSPALPICVHPGRRQMGERVSRLYVWSHSWDKGDIGPKA
uniref:Uncharacterized protein n=1 Tax=Rousettus aegyptiacus TaxID=9407 RepID=A0A7J8KB33_ROUAE|nr:hypothetical protein HJG63_007917 [Rousettus aegyptiacus]